MPLSRRRLHKFLVGCVLIVAVIGGAFALVLLVGAITGGGFSASILLGGTGLSLLLLFVFVFVIGVIYWKSSKSV
jgi:hypothetical protein